MKQYLLSVHHAEDFRPSPEAMQKIFTDVGAFNEELVAAGVWIFAGGLQPTSTATTLRLQGDEVVTTPGPIEQSKEPIGGCWIIKAPDLDTALEWGRKATRANTVPCELRRSGKILMADAARRHLPPAGQRRISAVRPGRGSFPGTSAGEGGV